MTIRIEEMGEHVMKTMRADDILFTWCRRPTEAWAGHELNEVCIAPIRSTISYSVALHEIGHIKGRYQLSRDSLVRERWAWVWAQANALIWTPAMERHRRVSLTYATRSRHRMKLLNEINARGGTA